MNRVIIKLLHAPRVVKRIMTVLIDVILLLSAYWGAIWSRLDINTPITSWHHWQLILSVIVLSIVMFIRLGLYRTVLRYVNAKIISTVMLGVVSSTVALVILAFFTGTFLPRTVPFIYFSLALLFITGSRFVFRWLVTLINRKNNGVPVIIYGAGDAGRQLLNALNQGEQYLPIAFIDDNKRLQKTVVHGVTIYSPSQLTYLLNRYDIKKILLAIPSMSRQRKREIIAQLEQYHCEVLSVPGMVDVVEGRLTADVLRPVAIEDLLGRDPVEPIAELISKNIKHKNVMVTGAGGSIGAELCRQIVQQQPKRLVLFEQSEYALYTIEKELNELISKAAIDCQLVAILGNVQLIEPLQSCMQAFDIQTIYHAAAYKHVPLVEYNIVAGVNNNIFGTLVCAQAAINAKVATFVLISTDKAVRPTNTMGATKRFAELILQALAKEQSDCRFCMVRFGNVLGSSGSVVPLFKKQLAVGGPITLTHPDIIRYFMTIPEAAQLVLQAGAMGQGGDVFVLDMGEPVKIIELAKRMVSLSGLKLRDAQYPDGIAIKITGLRPGEKLFEELLIGEQGTCSTQHARILQASEKMLPWQELQALLTQLEQACQQQQVETIRDILIAAPLDFTPSDSLCDVTWLQQMGKTIN